MLLFQPQNKVGSQLIYELQCSGENCLRMFLSGGGEAPGRQVRGLGEGLLRAGGAQFAEDAAAAALAAVFFLGGTVERGGALQVGPALFLSASEEKCFFQQEDVQSRPKAMITPNFEQT